MEGHVRIFYLFKNFIAVYFSIAILLCIHLLITVSSQTLVNIDADIIKLISDCNVRASILKVARARFFEKLVSTYDRTRRQKPKWQCRHISLLLVCNAIASDWFLKETTAAYVRKSKRFTLEREAVKTSLDQSEKGNKQKN
jgi:hypothetical protein